MGFPGGSAWAMAKDIQEGVLLVTERTFIRFQVTELDQLNFELEKQLRDVRGNQAALSDMPAIQLRNRKIQRLNTAQVILRTYRKNQKV